MQGTGISEQHCISCQFACRLSDELKGNIETQYETVRTLIELEQATSEFITGMELDAELPNAVRISKQKFTDINERSLST